MKKVLYSLFALAALGLSACSSNEGPDFAAEAEPINLNIGETQASVALNTLGVDFFAETALYIDETGENVAVSPLGLTFFAALTANADPAGGQAMAEALGLNDIDGVNSYFTKLISRLSGMDPSSKFALSNSLWYQSGLSPKSSFLSAAQNYGIETFARDLNANYDAVSSEMTDWVSRKTDGHIADFKPGLSDTQILVSTLLFKGFWKSQFKTEDTRKMEFNGRKTSSQVDMMYQSKSLPYLITPDAQTLRMDFGNGAFHALLVLPMDDKSLDSVDLCELLETDKAQFKQTNVDLYFPRFQYAGRGIDVTPLYNKLGLKSGGFSFIEGEELDFDCVNQDIFVQFDEEGATMASVTYAGDISAGTTPLKFDRPFYFFIRESSTGAILLAGRINQL